MRARRVAFCVHHWDLGAPRGSTVHAKCRKCGAERDYPSTVEPKFTLAQRKSKVDESDMVLSRKTQD